MANRLANATYQDGERTVALEPNWGDHQLHGGALGLHQQNWQGELVVDSRGPAVELTTVHSDGTDGYPGNLSIKVKYVLAENEQLHIEMLAICDQRRPVSLTTHPYFQLSKTGADQQLTVFAQRYLVTDEEQIPTGLLKPASTLFGGPLRASSVDELSVDHTFIFDDEQSSALAELQTNVLTLQCFRISQHFRSTLPDLIAKNFGLFRASWVCERSESDGIFPFCWRPMRFIVIGYAMLLARRGVGK